jgi:hypothetical protein
MQEKETHLVHDNSNNEESYSDDDSDFVDEASSLHSAAQSTLLLPSPAGPVHDDPSSLYQEHKKAFYATYTPLFKDLQDATNLITREKYNYIIKVLKTPKSTTERGVVRKIRKTYNLDGAVDGFCLYRAGKIIPTFESVFDVILEAHQQTGHHRDIPPLKSVINGFLNYYGVPRNACVCFIDTCPMVSDNTMLTPSDVSFTLILFSFISFSV